MNSTCFTATFVDSALTLSTAYAIKVSYRMIVHFELIFSHAIFLLESTIFFSTNPFSPSELCMLFLEFVPATTFTLHLADPLTSLANLDLLFHPVNPLSCFLSCLFCLVSDELVLFDGVLIHLPLSSYKELASKVSSLSL